MKDSPTIYYTPKVNGNLLGFNTTIGAPWKILISGAEFDELSEIQLDVLARIIFNDLALSSKGVCWVEHKYK